MGFFMGAFVVAGAVVGFAFDALVDGLLAISISVAVFLAPHAISAADPTWISPVYWVLLKAECLA